MLTRVYVMGVHVCEFGILASTPAQAPRRVCASLKQTHLRCAGALEECLATTPIADYVSGFPDTLKPTGLMYVRMHARSS